MTYALSFDGPAVEAAEGVRREQLERAADGLDEHGEDPVEAVHDARKRLKKTRSLLRLVRPALKTKAYRNRNRALRDTGRSLSGARDADVMAETVEDLSEQFSGQAPKTLFTAVHAPLAARAQASRSATDPGDAASRLRSLAHDPWPLRDLTTEALRASLKRTYTRGRDAFKLADREPTAEHLHEWRKRVKDLWYQQQLLEETWPGVQKAQAKEAKKLSKLLGEDHDLAVLADQLRNDPTLTDAPETDRDVLLDMIATRRAELLERVRKLGRRVYAERPKAFAKRQGRYVDLAAR